jgi:hypothetical protein
MNITTRFADKSPSIDGDANTNSHTMLNETGEKTVEVKKSMYRRGKDLMVPAA